MYRYKQPIAILLIICLIVPIFIITPLSNAKAAEPVTLTVAAVAGLAALLGLIGITFATTEAATEAAQNVAGMNDLWEDINSLYRPPNPNDPNDKWGTLAISVATTGMLVSVLAQLHDIFGDVSGTIEVPDPDTITYSNVSFIGDIGQFTDEQKYAFAPYSRENYSRPINTAFQKDRAVTFNYNGTQRYFQSYPDSLGTGWYVDYVNGTSSTIIIPGFYLEIPSSAVQIIDVKFGFHSTISSGLITIYPYMVACYKNTVDGPLRYKSKWTFDSDCSLVVGESQLETGVKEIPYEVSTDYPQEDIWTSINEIVVDNDEVEIPLTEVGDDIDSSDDDEFDEKKQGYWFDIIPGLRDLLEESNTYDPFPAPTPLPSPGTDGDPDAPYKPSITDGLPDLTTIWDYVLDFAEDALIWVKLWFSGFVLLPDPLKGTLWALLVISIFTGLLGVFLK